jgi:hypothetical protein
MVDPHTMKRGEILSFFDHIAKRQQTYDLPEVFRFKTAKVGRKGYKTLDALTLEDRNNNVDDTDADPGVTPSAEAPVRRSRPKPRKVPQRTGNDGLPRNVCNNNVDETCADNGLAPSAEGAVPLQRVPDLNDNGTDGHNGFESHQPGWRDPGQVYVFPDNHLLTQLPFSQSTLDSHAVAPGNVAAGKRPKKAKKTNVKTKAKQGEGGRALGADVQNADLNQRPDLPDRLLIKLPPAGKKQKKKGKQVSFLVSQM